MRELELDRELRRQRPPRARLRRSWLLYAMLAPPLALLAIFSYAPLYGLIMAFQNYSPAKGFSGSEFVGLKWFRMAMGMPDFKNILANTLSMAVGKIACGQLAAIVFALLLSEIRNMPYKRTVQTIAYFPHFLSWVIIGGVFIDLLSTRGLVNQLIGLFGASPVFFLGSSGHFQPTMIALETWKEFGYGAIIYLAAITGISHELYEAATIDGAGRLKRVWHVTLPGISVTIVMLAVLAIGGILSAGFDQILVMYNPAVYETGDILDTFIYRQGLIDAQFSLSTAIGLFKSAIGLALMLLANGLASKFAGYRIF
ncbi:MAG: ABC transporter permease subunit [Clostridiales bacterium]|nr:ABC transporter permease subunit [Clostridiales bacterium]